MPRAIIKPIGYSTSRTVLQSTCFWEWLALVQSLQKHCVVGMEYGTTSVLILHQINKKIGFHLKDDKASLQILNRTISDSLYRYFTFLRGMSDDLCVEH